MYNDKEQYLLFKNFFSERRQDHTMILLLLTILNLIKYVTNTYFQLKMGMKIMVVPILQRFFLKII